MNGVARSENQKDAHFYRIPVNRTNFGALHQMKNLRLGAFRLQYGQGPITWELLPE